MYQPCSWSCQCCKTSIVYPTRNDHIYFIYIVLLTCQNFPLHLDTWNSLKYVSICNFRSVSLILLQLLLELIPGIIPDRNLKHSNSIQYYHSSINDAMMFFLHMYEPEHQFFLCTLGLMYCIFAFFPYFKLLHKGTVHYCKRWVLNEKNF